MQAGFRLACRSGSRERDIAAPGTRVTAATFAESRREKARGIPFHSFPLVLDSLLSLSLSCFLPLPPSLYICHTSSCDSFSAVDILSLSLPFPVEAPSFNSSETRPCARRVRAPPACMRPHVQKEKLTPLRISVTRTLASSLLLPSLSGSLTLLAKAYILCV